MGDYADSITAERVKKVICGYKDGKNDVPGLPSDFCFYEIGDAMFDENGFLNSSLSLEKILDYVWYSETGGAGERIYNIPYLVGKCNEVAYYFYFEPNKVCTLNHSFLGNITVAADAYVVYADTCNLSEQEQLKYNIKFKKIPRDIAKL